MKIKNIMTTNVHTLSKNNTILDACILMRNRNIGAIPIVCNENEIEGIITDRDLVLSLASNKKLDTKINDIMTKKVDFLEETSHIFDLIELMGVKQIKRVPVVRNKKLVGIISVSDIARNTYLEEYAKDLFLDISYDPLKEFSPVEKNLKIDDFIL